jgi:hypothetical protein
MTYSEDLEKIDFVLLAFAARKQRLRLRGRLFGKCNSKTRTRFIIRTESKSLEFWISRTFPMNIISIFSCGLKAL